MATTERRGGNVAADRPPFSRNVMSAQALNPRSSKWTAIARWKRPGSCPRYLHISAFIPYHLFIYLFHLLLYLINTTRKKLSRALLNQFHKSCYIWDWKYIYYSRYIQLYLYTFMRIRCCKRLTKHGNIKKKSFFNSLINKKKKKKIFQQRNKPRPSASPIAYSGGSLPYNQNPDFLQYKHLTYVIKYVVVFFNEINERRSYPKGVHPLKAWVGSSIVKRRKNSRELESNHTIYVLEVSIEAPRD